MIKSWLFEFRLSKKGVGERVGDKVAAGCKTEFFQVGAGPGAADFGVCGI